MQKQMILLIGSPRRGGNSDVLAESFRKGAESAGHMVQKHYVADSKTKEHAGLLRRMIHNVLNKPTARQKLISRMCAADVIVLSTPVFGAHFPPETKRAMSAFFAACHDIEQKQFVLLVTAAEPEAGIRTQVLERFNRLFGVRRKPQLLRAIVCGEVWKPGDIAGRECLKEAEDFAAGL